MQVLQTLYILIQNLRRETALYYICSNNHLNDLMILPFDFEDEEVLGYYINLLKSISLQLTPKTAQFFYMVNCLSYRHVNTQCLQYVSNMLLHLRCCYSMICFEVRDSSRAAFLQPFPDLKQCCELSRRNKIVGLLFFLCPDPCECFCPVPCRSLVSAPNTPSLDLISSLKIPILQQVLFCRRRARGQPYLCTQRPSNSSTTKMEWSGLL